MDQEVCDQVIQSCVELPKDQENLVCGKINSDIERTNPLIWSIKCLRQDQIKQIRTR